MILEATFSGVTEKINPIGSEPITIYKCRKGGKLIILKCTDCGNTFKREGLKDGVIVACPICEADYQVIVRDGKIEISEYVYEGPDEGEL